MSASIAYLDASAIVKLVVVEPESVALAAFLKRMSRRVSSRIASVEVRRAAGRRVDADPDQAAAVLEGIELLDLTDAVIERSARVAPSGLRTLGAIHLASALELGEDLAALVTYDGRLAEVARALGVPVVSPA